MPPHSSSALERLPLEILVQIAELLNTPLSTKLPYHKPHPALSPKPSTTTTYPLYPLLFLRPFHAAALAVLYRRITIRGPSSSNSSHFLPTQHLISRILDPSDQIFTYIRELRILDWDGEYLPVVDEKVLDSIIYSVENLQVLETNRLSGSGVRWNEGRLKKLLKTFPELRGFGGDVEMVEVGWPLESLQVLSHFSALHTLTIRLTLPNLSNARGPPKVSTCHVAATDLFRAFFSHNPNSKLCTLQFTALRWEEIPIQDYILHTVVVGVRRSDGEARVLVKREAMGEGGDDGEVGFDVQIGNGRGGVVGEENDSINRFLGRAPVRG